MAALREVPALRAHALVVRIDTQGPAGLLGAQRGGMRAIGVRSSHADLQADIVVDTLAELPDDVFERLIPAG